MLGVSFDQFHHAVECHLCCRFLEREETCIIQLEQLEAQTREASTPEQRADVYKRFVDFHGGFRAWTSF